MSRILDIKLDQILFWKPAWDIIHTYGGNGGIPGDYETGHVQRYIGGDQEKLPEYSTDWDDCQLALEEMWRRGYRLVLPPITSPEEISKIIFEKLGGEIRVLFEDCYRKYNNDTFISSNPNDTLNNPHFLKIVAMGKDALPFIFEKIRIAYQGIDFIFMAAWKITGADPIPEELCGRMKPICDTWLKWAEDHGYGKTTND